ncbi:MAG: peptide chain release factor N(5)-glutamine methyltransferase [Pseudomonadota bacterium]
MYPWRVDSQWSVKTMLAFARQKLAAQQTPSPHLEAEVLLAHVLDCPRLALLADPNRPLLAGELARYHELLDRRLGGEPVAYLVGGKEFWSLWLGIDHRVLIPRADTETLVEVALRHLRAHCNPSPRIVDVGTGSGAVAIALAREIRGAFVIATDSSADALAVARRNVDRHGLGSRIALVRADLVRPFATNGSGSDSGNGNGNGSGSGSGRGHEPHVDLVVSNPPYVPTGELPTLPLSVSREPRQALDGGTDGLDVIRRLVPAAAALLRTGGALAIEHGWEQGASVVEVFRQAGFADASTTRDLGGRDRVTSGCRA